MKKWLTYQLRSAALQFTIFIAVLVALLLGGLVLYVYTFVFLKTQSKATIANIELADSAINYLLLHPTSSDTIRIPYLEDENQKVNAHLSYWGIFEKGVVNTWHRKKKFTKIAIIGSSLNSNTDPTLCLKDTYAPLSVVGATKIKGIAYLPQQGVKPGYINGETYYGTQLVYGPIRRTPEVFPKINKSCRESLLFYHKSYQPHQGSIPMNLTPKQKIINSFKSATIHYFSSSPIILDDVELRGNIIVKSDTLIQIKKNAKLNDIILIAPHIVLEDQTTGNFQCIASESIKVGSGCRLSFPTALILIEDPEAASIGNTQKPIDNQIWIDGKTIINGNLCYLQSMESADYKTQIFIEKNSQIRGQVYCEGNLDLKGTISGSVYTKQFTSHIAGSVYINHLMNATIENDNIPVNYGGIVFEGNPKKCVFKWLY